MLLYRSLDLMEESLNVLFDKHVHYHKETKFSISPKLKSKVLKKAIFWENSRIHSKSQKKKIKNKKNRKQKKREHRTKQKQKGNKRRINKQTNTRAIPHREWWATNL
jgi:hypothetical protein